MRLRRFWRSCFLAVGLALVAAAIVLDEAWLLRHVQVPALYLPTPAKVWMLLRGAAAAVGLALAAASGPLSRLLERPRDALRIGLAALLALAVSEWITRRHENGTTFWRARKIELRLGHDDPRYGWVFWPSRTTVLAVRGAVPVPYAVDAWGDRAASDRGAPDPARPSLVVAGESVAVGHGLRFEETFAALLAARLGLQLVNVGAGGYGTDQSLLRLEDALSRLQRPAATVLVFLPLQLIRNVQDYRPRLALRGGELALVPAADGPLARLRLRDLAVNEIPVLGEAKLREALAVTAAELRRAAAASRARGAAHVVLVISVGPQRAFEAHPEADVLRELLVAQQIPFSLVDVDVPELVPYDGHPAAPASRRIADALEHELRKQLR
jgi:hypothetical protein